MPEKQSIDLNQLRIEKFKKSREDDAMFDLLCATLIERDERIQVLVAKVEELESQLKAK